MYIWWEFILVSFKYDVVLEMQVFDAYEDSSARSDSKGFWGVLARKAKAILEEDNMSSQLGTPDRTMFQISETSVDGQVIISV